VEAAEDQYTYYYYYSDFHNFDENAAEAVAMAAECGVDVQADCYDGGDVLACGTYEFEEAADAWVDGDTTTYGDIADWDVSCVTDMDFIFRETTAFDGDLGDWDVSKVTYMAMMFDGATAFNGDLSDWDVASVTTMQMMFHEAPYDRDLDWCVDENVPLTGAFAGTICAEAGRAE
jgi:surface protein